ncbi:hypothetical protein M7I_7928 [Glarea lozoyensis 74030]|uniref:Uncharacterized protein n=1 Tax=Glarea lozoyensis (strain ATCC 74030 / MF5533) TaxID=1104152 RepID=H0EYM2_GLAL7|nr:hypothetical protein M7I_7928 [Glarea lozoyensis 74030]
MKLRSAKTYELPPSDKAKGRSSTLKSRSEAKRAAAKRKAVANHNRGSKLVQLRRLSLHLSFTTSKSYRLSSG